MCDAGRRPSWGSPGPTACDGPRSLGSVQRRYGRATNGPTIVGVELTATGATAAATQVFGNHGPGPRCSVALGPASRDRQGRATECLGTQNASDHRAALPRIVGASAGVVTATARPRWGGCGPGGARCCAPGGRPRARDRASARSPSGGRQAGSDGAERRRLDLIQPNSAVHRFFSANTVGRECAVNQRPKSVWGGGGRIYDGRRHTSRHK